MKSLAKCNNLKTLSLRNIYKSDDSDNSEGKPHEFWNIADSLKEILKIMNYIESTIIITNGK